MPGVSVSGVSSFYQSSSESESLELLDEELELELFELFEEEFELELLELFEEELEFEFEDEFELEFEELLLDVPAFFTHFPSINTVRFFLPSSSARAACGITNAAQAVRPAAIKSFFMLYSFAPA